MRRSDVNLILSRICVSLAGVILALQTKANDSMIELFTYGSTNGHKVAIALEELGLPYEVRVVNVFAGEGQSAAFLTLNPTGKIPVIRDRELDIVITESDAILLYLADKAQRLVSPSGRERTRALELLFLQASLQGPMFGQRMHFSPFASESVPYGIRRYEEQCDIIDKLVDQLLTERSYFLGAQYSIVDSAFYGWYFAAKSAGFTFDRHPSLSAWFERVAARPAVARGVTIPFALPNLPPRKRA
jgi:GST-like protein